MKDIIYCVSISLLAIMVGYGWISVIYRVSSLLFQGDPSPPIIEIIEIDSCEYIDRGYHKGFAHKGNCNNPIHIYFKKEIK